MLFYTIVNKETCISCGSCEAIAPDLFNYDDEGLSYYIGDNNYGSKPVCQSLIDDLEDAYEECPTNSIKMANQPFDGNPLRYELVKEG